MLVLALGHLCRGQSAEERAAKRFEAVRHQPSLLLAFLREMPRVGICMCIYMVRFIGEHD